MANIDITHDPDSSRGDDWYIAECECGVFTSGEERMVDDWANHHICVTDYTPELPHRPKR